MMSKHNQNIMTALLAVCALIASAIFVLQYQAMLNFDESAVWFEQYCEVVEEAGWSVVALETVSPDSTSPRRYYQQNYGSGFIISESGEIVTNEHVIHDAIEIRVTLKDRRQFFAKVLAQDPRADIAILKIDATDLTPIEIGDINELKPGQLTIALGNPLGTGDDGIPVATFGRINRLNKTLRSNFQDNTERFYDNLIQTSAMTRPGNSGGPLINTMGQAIGIITAVGKAYPAGKEFGFAITLNSKTLKAIDRLKNSQSINYAFLGVITLPVDQETQKKNQLEDASGALVRSIIRNSAAAKAGILQGDIIKAVNELPVHSPEELSTAICHFQPGELVTVTVIRARENDFPGKFKFPARLTTNPQQQ